MLTLSRRYSFPSPRACRSPSRLPPSGDAAASSWGNEAVPGSPCRRAVLSSSAQKIIKATKPSVPDLEAQGCGPRAVCRRSRCRGLRAGVQGAAGRAHAQEPKSGDHPPPPTPAPSFILPPRLGLASTVPQQTRPRSLPACRPSLPSHTSLSH